MMETACATGGERLRSTVPPYFRAAAIGILVVALYYDVVASLVSWWWLEEAHSHGLLVAPLALWLAWRQRKGTLAEPSAPDSRGLGLMLAACLAYLVGKLGAEFFLTRMSLLMLVSGLIWTFWGLGRLRRLAFPLILLASVVPLPTLVYNQLTGPLQLLASTISTEVAHGLGVSVYRDGNVIHLASGSFGVAEACSGLRSIGSLIVAALLLGYLDLTRLSARVAVFLLAIPIAIAFNVFRVAGTALLADYSAEWAQGFYHLFSGWLVFLAGFGTLFLATRGIRAVFDRKTSGGAR